MKALYDIFSIIIFVIVYYFYGFYSAVAAINIMMFLGVILYRLKFKKFDRMQVAIFLVILLLSIPTFVMHNELFFKWKPSIISWIFAAGLLLSPWFGEKKTLFQRILEKENIQVSKKSHHLINLLWVIYFIVFGGVNLLVAYLFSTKVWVWFKLIGSLGSMIIMALLTTLILYPQLRDKQE
ncbi:MAG: septation protein IspZ [Legionellales bacterium]|nr:septation protein IspZ [Legionellales bacterium]